MDEEHGSLRWRRRVSAADRMHSFRKDSEAVGESIFFSDHQPNGLYLERNSGNAGVLSPAFLTTMSSSRVASLTLTLTLTLREEVGFVVHQEKVRDDTAEKNIYAGV